jgi:hypothetical protein
MPKRPCLSNVGLLLLGAGLACAQNQIPSPPLSPIFPTRALVDSDFGLRSDTCSTNLANQMGPTDTTFTVTNPTGCPTTNFIMQIGQELVFVASASGSTFTVASGGRGYSGTTALGHIQGLPVTNNLTAYQWDRIVSEVESMSSYVLTHGGGGGGGLSYFGSATNAILSAYSSTQVFNPNSTATLSSGGTISTPGSGHFGVGGGAASSVSVNDATGFTWTIGAGSAMTASWTISPGSTVPATGDLVKCVTTGTVCVLSDYGSLVVPLSQTSTAHNWINSYSATTGLFTIAQPAFTDISGTATAAQLPTGTSSAKGILQGDGSTLSISAGVISCTTATTSQIGCGKPDGSTITVTAGVWSSVSGGGTVTVVGSGSLTSTDCVTGGGSQTLQTPSSACHIDSSGNVTENSAITSTLKDANGNPFLISTATASAVDSVTLTNAATANPATVAISATGSDSNIKLNLVSKGTGVVELNGTAFGTAATASTGTSGATLGLLNGSLTFSGADTFSSTLAVIGNLTTNITGGGTQCVVANNSGLLSGTACNAGTLGYQGSETANAILASYDSAHVFNPNATATLSSSGLVSTPGGVNVGVGSGVSASIGITDASGFVWTLGAGASMTASWTINPGSTVPASGDFLRCVTSATVCVLQDSGVPATAGPYSVLGNINGTSGAPAFTTAPVMATIGFRGTSSGSVIIGAGISGSNLTVSSGSGISISPTPSPFTGTSGSASCSQSSVGTLKLASCILSAYANTSTAQTYAYPVAFNFQPALIQSSGGSSTTCGTYSGSSTATTLTLPANAAMGAETCQIIAMGN